VDSRIFQFWFGEHVYKIALYSPEAQLDASTSAYNPAYEVEASGDYVPGGQVLEGFSVGLDSGVAYLDWAVDPEWKGATIMAAGALVYNATRDNRALLRRARPSSSPSRAVPPTTSSGICWSAA
jgi:hypothetical protein